MALSVYQELSWDNPKTFYLSQIWSLYCRQINWDWQLCDLGYYGYADVRFTNGAPSPDILAFHPQGDVQHIHIESFPDYTFGQDAATDEEKLDESLEAAQKTADISSSTVSSYVRRRGNHDFTPKTQENVCVLPERVYREYSPYIDNRASEKGVILWLIDANGETLIWKETGSHSNLKLDDEIANRLKAYPSSNDLLQYTRSTDRDRLKFEFIQRLARRCGRMNQLEITYDEVDNIMVETHPPILGHLPAREREDYWADFLWSMLNRFELLEQSESEPNRYIWTEKRFIHEPRHRHKILNNIQEDLGLGPGGSS